MYNNIHLFNPASPQYPGNYHYKNNYRTIPYRTPSYLTSPYPEKSSYPSLIQNHNQYLPPNSGNYPCLITVPTTTSQPYWPNILPQNVLSQNVYGYQPLGLPVGSGCSGTGLKAILIAILILLALDLIVVRPNKYSFQRP